MDNTDISQISAELLLNMLYPEMADKWIAHCAGTFYRNYNNDIMSLYNSTSEVVLSRDGYLKMLPEGLLTDEEELKKGDFSDEYQKMQQRMKVLQEAFLPLDTFRLRQSLVIEKETSALLSAKLSYLLKSIFQYDIDAEPNRYVKQMAVLLPYVSKLRADFGSICKLLGLMLHCTANMKMSRYSDIDSTRCWIPKVEYQLLISDLSAEEYNSLMEEIKPLQNFINEWMIPASMVCEITIRYHCHPQAIGKGLILNYNSEF